MSDSNILKTPGELLGEARERQGLSLEALAERTKIPAKVLAALEMDEYHKVSGPLYIKSFLRTCATDLGLDADMILDLYSRFGGEAGPPTGEGGEMVWNEEQVTVTRVGLPWPRWLLFGGIAVVLFGVGLFAFRGCGAGETEGDPGPVDSVEARPPEDPRRGSLLAADSTAAGDGAAVDVTGEETMPPAGDEAGEQEGKAASRAAESAPDETGAEEETIPVREESTPPESDPDPVREDTTPDRQTEQPRETGGPAYEDRDEPPVRNLGGLPAALAGHAGTPFADGRTWPVVMRLVTDLPVGAEIRRDGESAYQSAAWSDPVALPMRDIRPGRAYGVREGLVVYWGADDHFSLRLDRVVGVEISINGVVRDISSLGPGQEIILDDHSAAGAGR